MENQQSTTKIIKRLKHTKTKNSVARFGKHIDIANTVIDKERAIFSNATSFSQYIANASKRTGGRFQKATFILTGLELVFTGLSILVSGAALWNGLRNGGELRPVTQNKLKISVEALKMVAALALFGMGIAAVFSPAAPLLAVIGAGLGFGVVAYQFLIDMIHGNYHPLHENKLKLSTTLATALVGFIAIVLALVACFIPGVAPIMAVLGAFSAFAMLVYQLITDTYDLSQAQKKLKYFNNGAVGKELEVLQNTPSLREDQKTRLQDLCALQNKLQKQCNWMKKTDIGCLGIALIGALLAVIGLALVITVPPVGFSVAAAGAVLGVVSALIKFAAFLGSYLHKKYATKKSPPSLTQSSVTTSSLVNNMNIACPISQKVVPPTVSEPTVDDLFLSIKLN